MNDEHADARRVATDAGLPWIDDLQLAQFARGLMATRDLAARLPKDLHWSEEPAPIVTLAPSRRSAP